MVDFLLFWDDQHARLYKIYDSYLCCRFCVGICDYASLLETCRMFDALNLEESVYAGKER